VLYGIPENENDTEKLTDNLVSFIAEKLKLQISPTQIFATRIGKLKPSSDHRTRPVRIHFLEAVDRLEMWKASFSSKRYAPHVKRRSVTTGKDSKIDIENIDSSAHPF